MSELDWIPVAWFRREDWFELKGICVDLQDTYDEWLANAESNVAALDDVADLVDKVVLTLDRLRQHYQAIGRKLDAKERADIAFKLAMERSRIRH